MKRDWTPEEKTELMLRYRELISEGMSADEAIREVGIHPDDAFLIQEKFTPEEMVELMKKYREMLKEGKAEEEINEELGIDPEDALIL